MNNNSEQENYLIVRSNSRGSRRRSSNQPSKTPLARTSKMPINEGGLSINTINIPIPTYGDEEVEHKKEVSFSNHMQQLRNMNDSLKEK
mmetsp:Transcript_31945/g.28303  ORF Transcript_31945/g.28303 Transcript_31945/m.28303 type:complete len:89 (-) Transcript_31945:366-632(-)